MISTLTPFIIPADNIKYNLGEVDPIEAREDFLDSGLDLAAFGFVLFSLLLKHV